MNMKYSLKVSSATEHRAMLSNLAASTGKGALCSSSHDRGKHFFFAELPKFLMGCELISGNLLAGTARKLRTLVRGVEGKVVRGMY